MATSKMMTRLALVFALIPLAGCMFLGGPRAQEIDWVEAERGSVVTVTETKLIHDTNIGGIVDIYVGPRSDDEPSAITVIGISGIAVLDHDYHVRERFSFQNSRAGTERKVINIDGDGEPIIVSWSSGSFTGLVQAHDLMGKHLWSHEFPFWVDFLDEYRCKDGRVAICAVRAYMNESHMAIVSLEGEELFSGALPWVNTDMAIAVFDIGDEDRLWFGSHNKVIAIDEFGDQFTKSVGSRFAYVNMVDDYRLLGETNERAILFSYSRPVGLLGFFHKQRDIVFVGESMASVRQEKVVDEDLALGRTNGTKLDDAGKYWARYYPIRNQTTDSVMGRWSGSMMISTAEGTWAGRHDFTPLWVMESGGDDGAMAIVERHGDHAIALAGKGKWLWVARVDFPAENPAVESQLAVEAAANTMTAGERK